VGHCGKTNDSVDFPLFNIFDENKNKIEVNKSYQIALIFFLKREETKPFHIIHAIS